MAPRPSSDYHEGLFEASVKDVLKSVQRILDVNRNPRLASEVEHEYIDKFALSDVLTNTAIIAQINVLERLGLGKDVLKKIDKSKPTTLRFVASDSCSLLKEQTVEVRLPTSVETVEDSATTGSIFATTKKSTISNVVKRVKEFHWEVKVNWEISIYSGTDIDTRTILDSRSSSMIVVVPSENAKPPLPLHTDHTACEVSLVWLLKQIDTENLTSQFHIDTNDVETKTPRRNRHIQAALRFMALLAKWALTVRAYFDLEVQRRMVDKHNPVKPSFIEANRPPNLVKLTAEGIFIPVFPLMEEETTKEDNSQTTSGLGSPSFSIAADETARDKSPVLSSKDITRFLDEQIRTLEEKQQSIANAFPARQLLKLVSVAEASLCVLCLHSLGISKEYQASVNFVESMVENQLIKAIGKRISSSDLDQFVKYHNARFLTPAPRPFCHSIRRPQHFPEGSLSIESAVDGGKMEPIETHVRVVDHASGLKLALNSATTVELTGKKFLHGWLNHTFHDTSKSFQLISRARQFSSFMLVIGTMAGHDQMQPKDAIVIRDKDEVKIPLLLNEIPSAKEFKDAIGSLSPEQQRFARAYRSMQLESSVLGICVIQIKPQLEVLLGLPHDALTKEMKLTQDLMELFVDYQVPSDLLSFDGEHHEASTSDKVKNVKGHVKSVLDVIEGAKKKQMEDQIVKTDMAIERSYEIGPEMASALEILRSCNNISETDDDMAALGSCGSFMRRSATATRCYPESVNDWEGGRPPPFEKLSGAAFGSASLGSAMPGSAIRRATACSYVVEETGYPGPEKERDLALSSILESEVGRQTGDGNTTLDFTTIPKILDSCIEKYDKDGALRSTTIKTSDLWDRTRQENLLTQAETHGLDPKGIKSEKDKAFDLLDALSRSGSLPISFSELHVVICVTHRFEKDVMGTVIQDNINPIEKLEMSTLLVASAILGVSASPLVRGDGDRARLASSIPTMFEDISDET